MGLLKNVVIWFLVIVMLAVIANTVFSFMGNMYDYNEPVEVNLTLTAPEVFTYQPHKFEPKPIPSGRSGPGYSFYMESLKSEFYEYYGGIMKIWFENEGDHTLFIYEYGIKPDWVSKDKWVPSYTGITVKPGEKKLLGLKNFEAKTVKVNDGVMTCSVEYSISFMAKRDDGKWYDYGTVLTDPMIVEVKPAIKDTQKEYVSNPKFLFEELNRLVDKNDKGVIEISKKISDRYPGKYNIYQVCALFDYVSESIKYVPDPDDTEIWQTPNETLRLGTGDCEDYAILMASLIGASGGNSRIYLTDDHAFAAVYVGNDTVEIDKAIRTYYNTPATIYFISDGYGEWLILDTVSGFYTGNLPVGAKPSKMDWDFENSTKITAIDLIES